MPFSLTQYFEIHIEKKTIVDIVICKLGWSIFLRQYGGVTKWVNRNKKRGKKQIFRVQKRMVISFVHRAGGCCSGAFQSRSARFWLDCSQLEWAIYTEGQWWYELPRYKYTIWIFSWSLYIFVSWESNTMWSGRQLKHVMSVWEEKINKNLRFCLLRRPGTK